MKEPEKILPSKTKINNALDLRDKIRKEIEKFETFDLSYFLGKSHFEDDGALFQFICSFKCLILASQLQCQSTAVCQMKALNYLLHQIIVLIQPYIVMIILK